ncbi:MAG TPA: carboxypeptidase-like regulatory domain-containing protein [Pyrinomonadaceae bacterium]|nr:carboxypeptidase-like regulatory domain-containing protein [Pyrinomonadaceae bacterium]
MISSARHTIICILLSLYAGVCVQAQTVPQKVATASISGKVTIKGKPAAGVVVLASDSRDRGSSNVKGYRARSDQAGNYRITNLPAGNYEISALTAALVPSNESQALVVSEGEQLEDVNISLVPGGVITGKITNADGEPLIGEHVRIEPVHEEFPRGVSRQVMDRLYSGENSTDDRGVYRAFGLPPGKYKVVVGSSGFSGGSRQSYKEMFYPSVTDRAKATVIEVKEGSETDNVNIVVSPMDGTFKVSGQVVDGETGKPIANVSYGVRQTIDQADGSSSSSGSMGGELTNAKGEFRLENLTPGRYTIFTAPVDSHLAPASVSFDLVDRDIANLVIKTPKGSSLSGVVVLDRNESPSLLNGVRICAVTEGIEQNFRSSMSNLIADDGAFVIKGVRSGPVHLWLCVYNAERRQFEVVRVERNGIPQPNAFNVKEREDVAGLRVVLKYSKLTGAIRGQVRVENGELPPASQLHLLLWPLEENLEPKRSSSVPRPELDARGRFFVEGLAAGHYRLSVYVLQPGSNRMNDPTIQRVTVTDDVVTEVTLTIKAKPD